MGNYDSDAQTWRRIDEHNDVTTGPDLGELGIGPVVDLAIRDYLSPRSRSLLQTDPDLPRRLHGDPDDIGTMALADFLAPAVILSADNVFTRLGLSNTTAITWVGTAFTLLRAAGFEATYTDALMFTEVAARLLAAGGAAVVRTATRHPIPALALLAVGVYLTGRAGYLDRGRLRDGTRRLGEAACPLAERLAAASEKHGRARSALLVIEPYGSPTVEQRAGRHLARCGRPLTPPQLRDALNRTGPAVSAAELKCAMLGHPAFTRRPGDLYTIGRVARSAAGAH